MHFIHTSSKNMVADGDTSWRSQWRSEAKALTALVIPIMIQMGSQQMMTSVDLLFLGRLGRQEMAVGTIATTIFNLLWFGVAGFGTSFDTLGSQAAGAGDKMAVRNWALLAALSLSACCVPCALVLTCGSPIASTLLSQDEATSRSVGSFCTLLVLGLWPAAVTLVMQKFLQVRNVVMPVAVTSLITFILNIVLNWFFIHGVGVGLLGSALATSASRVVNLLLLAGYMRCSPEDWQAFTGPFPGDTSSGSGAGAGSKGGGAAVGKALTTTTTTTTTTMVEAMRSAASTTTKGMVQRMTWLGSRGAVMVAAEASSFDMVRGAGLSHLTSNSLNNRVTSTHTHTRTRVNSLSHRSLLFKSSSATHEVN